jgi:hypothetical protein
VNEASDGELKAVWYKINMDEELSVPAVAVSRPENVDDSVAIVFADKGKRTLSERVKELLEDHSVVIAIDTFSLGECILPSAAFWQYAQMVSAVGERSLGVQVAQIGAAIEWARQEFNVDSISLYGDGWESGVIALSASSLYNDRVASVDIKDCPKTLKKLIEDHIDYEDRPVLFCFGLLEQFDIPELIALCSPIKMKIEWQEAE